MDSSRAETDDVLGEAPSGQTPRKFDLRRIAVFVYGVVAYLAFLITILYAIGFVGDFVVPKTIDSGSTGPLATAVAIDAILLGAFALQHSGMARPAFKRWWTSIVPEPVERSTYVLLSSAVLGVLFWQWRPIPETVWYAEEPLLRAVILGFYGLGWAIVVLSTFMISHADLFGLKQVYVHLRGSEPSPPEFQVRYLYRFVRHPIMLGFIVAFWATPEMTVGHLLFAVAATGYIFVGIRLEERDLLEVHGDDYARYREEVPMVLPFGRRKSK